MNIKQPKSWRDQIKIHPAADLLPTTTADEVKILGEDIKKNRLHIPVAFFKEQKHSPPKLLDGIRRLDAIEAVGFTISVNNIGPDSDPHIRLWMRGLPNDQMGWPIEVTEVRGDQGVDPYDYVISANVHRRHLTIEQKDDLIAKVLKARPSKSNRQVAKMVGVSHPHVAAVRAELEKSGDVETVTTSIDTKGRKQPARKPAKKKRRDIDDYLAGKKARTAATKDADAPGPEGCIELKTTTTFKEQFKGLSSELATFSNDYFARVREWTKTYPNNQYIPRMASVLERVSRQMQMLAQDIEGRNPDDNDEAARALAEPPVGDGLDIPPFLKRT